MGRWSREWVTGRGDRSDGAEPRGPSRKALAEGSDPKVPSEGREPRGPSKGGRAEAARGGGPICWDRAEGTDLFWPSRHTHKQTNEQEEGQSSRVPEWPSIGHAES